MVPQKRSRHTRDQQKQQRGGKKTSSSGVKKPRLRPEQKIRYAVVGLGHIAQSAVLPAFSHSGENSELAALVSGSNEKLRKLGRKFGVKALYTYDQLEDCLESENIDAVYITLPNSMHREFTVRCARSKAHVLCEKPLAVDAAECQEMQDAARENSVYLMTAYRLHFDEANLEVLKLIRNEKIGDPRVFTSVLSFQVARENIRLDYSLGGGALLDLGVYPLNIMRAIFNSEPEAVIGAFLSRDDERFQQVESTCSALLKFPQDRVAHFTCSFATDEISYLEVIGTTGSVRLTNAFSHSESAELTVTVKGKTQRKKFRVHDQFAAEILYFSNCILNGRPPEPLGREGQIDLEIVEAIRESADRGREVELHLTPRERRPDQEQEITKPPTDESELIDVAPPSGA